MALPNDPNPGAGIPGMMGQNQLAGLGALPQQGGIGMTPSAQLVAQVAQQIEAMRSMQRMQEDRNQPAVPISNEPIIANPFNQTSPVTLAQVIDQFARGGGLSGRLNTGGIVGLLSNSLPGQTNPPGSQPQPTPGGAPNLATNQFPSGQNFKSAV